MSTKGRSKEAAKDSEMVEGESPRSLSVANKGIQTAGDFAEMMSALMSDLIEGRVTPQVGNATVNAGGKLLKVVELQYKYGNTSGGKPDRSLKLVS